MSTAIVEQQVNWEGLIDDLAWLYAEEIEATPYHRIPLSAQALAKKLKVPRMTLQGWRDGSQPKHSDGEALIRVWCTLSGKARTFVPMCSPTLSANKMR